MNYQPHPDDHASSDRDSAGQAPDGMCPLSELDALAEELARRIEAHLGIQRGEVPQ